MLQGIFLISVLNEHQDIYSAEAGFFVNFTYVAAKWKMCLVAVLKWKNQCCYSLKKIVQNK